MRYSSVVNLQQSMKALTFGLTLVRHGETQYNKEGLLQGQLIDAPLSESGLQQAEAAGCYLKHVLFSNVFVSDMLRARQTAETIMKHNTSCLGLQAVWDPLLKEKSFGTAEGGRVQDLREMAKAAGQTFLDFTPPEGETQEQDKKYLTPCSQAQLLTGLTGPLGCRTLRGSSQEVMVSLETAPAWSWSGCP
ncbi:probable fructose-2,6-bisphosphatase TIGAR A isoform X2 [Notothenia coriiceps]|uniref:fructose-2,6-bisphosphate 2-phosphatase n=1 Tax=Notothenia coriiceps TaxID=8208 RepID=A0A6I9Q7U3_9TELE|nr:PREDICTED: probable fructose-2,6-bisphosphatase TIGAR A isoform X2 [Notothenia coriiceps]